MITLKHKVPVYEILGQFGGKDIADFISDSFPIISGSFYTITNNDSNFQAILKKVLKVSDEVGVNAFSNGFIKIYKNQKDAQYIGYIKSDNSQILFAAVDKLNESLQSKSLLDAINEVRDTYSN